LEGRKSKLYCWKAGKVTVILLEGRKVTGILLEGRKSNSYIVERQEK
jgi:hypothetical protein